MKSRQRSRNNCICNKLGRERDSELTTSTGVTDGILVAWPQEDRAPLMQYMEECRRARETASNPVYYGCSHLDESREASLL